MTSNTNSNEKDAIERKDFVRGVALLTIQSVLAERAGAKTPSSRSERRNAE